MGIQEDATIGLLRDEMNRIALRTSITASNIANVDTPGYRAKQVEFAEQLGLATSELDLRQTARGHARGAAAHGARALVFEAPATRMRSDGNTVDIDREMTALAQQKGRFRVAAQLVRKRFALMRYALTDGRG